MPGSLFLDGSMRPVSSAWQSAHRFQSMVCESEKYHPSVMRDFTTGICMPEKLRYSQILIHCLKITTVPLMTGLTTGKDISLRTQNMHHTCCKSKPIIFRGQ